MRRHGLDPLDESQIISPRAVRKLLRLLGRRQPMYEAIALPRRQWRPDADKLAKDISL